MQTVNNTIISCTTVVELVEISKKNSLLAPGCIFAAINVTCTVGTTCICVFFLSNCDVSAINRFYRPVTTHCVTKCIYYFVFTPNMFNDRINIAISFYIPELDISFTPLLSSSIIAECYAIIETLTLISNLAPNNYLIASDSMPTCTQIQPL